MKLSTLNPTTTARTAAALAVFLAALAVPALAQDTRKPPPPPPPAPARAGQERLGSFPDWLAAYQRAGNPRLLFYTDLITTNRGDVKLLNDAATVTRLGGRLEQWFRAPEVILLNRAAAELTTDEQRKSLREGDEFTAANLVGRQAQADIVIFIRLIEQSGRKDGVAYTGTYLMADLRQGTSIDRHSWDMTPDPQSGEFDANRMGQYAVTLADRITEAFITQFPPEIAPPPAPITPPPAAAAPTPIAVPDQGPGVAPKAPIIPPPAGGVPSAPAASAAPVVTYPTAARPAPLAARRFTVRLAGDYEDRLVIGFRDSLTRMPYVRPGSLVERGLSQADGVKTMAFEMMYSGTVIDLQNDLANVASDRLEQDTAVLDAREGLVVVQLRPARLSARERLLVAGGETWRNASLRQQFRDAYTAAGRPRFAVMVNAAADKSDPALAANTPHAPVPGPINGDNNAAAAGTSPQIIVSPRIIVGNNADPAGNAGHDEVARRDQQTRERELRESRAIDTRTMEDNLHQHLIKLGLDTRDLGQAQAALDHESHLTGQTLAEQELATDLARRAGVDIIISGAGRVLRTSADGYPSRLRYTFRAYRTSDGAILAADSVEDDVDYTKPQWSQALERLAEEASGKMAAQLMDGWDGGGWADRNAGVAPPRSFDLTITGLATDADADAITARIRDGIPAVTRVTPLARQRAAQGLTATYRIESSSDPDQLRAALTALQDLPIQLETVSADRDRVLLRAKAK